MGQTEEAIVNGLPYIHTFRAFDRVVSTSFGVTLEEGYKEAIGQFKAAYLSLDITVTPKVSIIVTHKQYLKPILGPHSIPTYLGVPSSCKFQCGQYEFG